jgi:transposase InsO family protein
VARRGYVQPATASLQKLTAEAPYQTTFIEEMIYRRARPARHELEMEVFSFIEGFYNPLRRHSRLGNLSPVVYERTITTQDQESGQ